MNKITSHNKRNTIGFLNKMSSEDNMSPSKKINSSKKGSLKETMESQRPLKSNNSRTSIIGNSHSILSAGVSTDQSNHNKSNNGYIGKNTNNTIFSPNAISSLSKEKSNDEKTKEIKSALKKVKSGWEENKKEELVNNIKNIVISDKKSNISSVHVNDGSVGKQSSIKSSISIFDSDKNFSRVPEKTEGEKSRDYIRLNKETKSKEWIKSNNKTSNNFIQNLIDGI